MPSANPRRVVENFCSKFPTQLAELTHIVGDDKASQFELKRNLKKLHEESHRLKGAAYCMGFPILGAQFFRLEQDTDSLIQSKEDITPKSMERIYLDLSKIAKLRSHIAPDQSRLVQSFENPAPRVLNDNDTDEIRKLLKAQRILFVEDDISVRNLVRELLTDIGVGEVRMASSGEEALSLMKTFTPTLMLSDWHMKPIDGLSLLRLVRAGQTRMPSQTPIIFLTSENNAEKIHTVIRNGVDHVLVKPFNRAVVMRAITRVAQQSRPH
ncbi:response regulator [Oceanicaulis sp. LC35]|uniref:response regulator n=1 Tax=Oceanicaulis sp. LC35 TaxID=3349635 RepID=UPI003F852356